VESLTSKKKKLRINVVKEKFIIIYNHNFKTYFSNDNIGQKQSGQKHLYISISFILVNDFQNDIIYDEFVGSNPSLALSRSRMEVGVFISLGIGRRLAQLLFIQLKLKNSTLTKKMISVRIYTGLNTGARTLSTPRSRSTCPTVRMTQLVKMPGG
jgi:hypothetical protein